MDTPEPVNIDYLNDLPIIEKFVYPTWQSLCKLFFVFVLYTIIGAIILGLFLVDAKNMVTPLVKSLSNLVFYVITMSLTIRYAIRKSKKQTPSAINFSFNKMQSRLIPIIMVTIYYLGQ